MFKSKTTSTASLDARNRLVMAALRLFAEKGFEAASTREICEAAEVNISSIRYYFGDKAGLYRAAFKEPLGEYPCLAHLENYLSMPLIEALVLFFNDFLSPLKMSEEIQMVMKLHFREMIEPTGVWQEEIDAEIKPQHEALLLMLCQHLQVEQVDDDIQRMAFAIIGMAVHFYVGQQVVHSLAPNLLNSHQHIDLLAERMAGYGVSIIQGEYQRRQASAGND